MDTRDLVRVASSGGRAGRQKTLRTSAHSLLFSFLDFQLDIEQCTLQVGFGNARI